MAKRDHWNAVYDKKGSETVSWYRPHLDLSLEFIERSRVPLDAAILDVGGGASTLVDDLVSHGFTRVSVLDLSASAIDIARERLGPRADGVRWIVGDVTQVALEPGAYDLWHDRAVFHFLREADERRRYVQQVLRALKPGGYAIVATFGPEGPEKCSGLEVARYSADEIHAEFGGAFEKIDSRTEVHETPWGSEQQFVYCYCRSTATRP